MDEEEATSTLTIGTVYHPTEFMIAPGAPTGLHYSGALSTPRPGRVFEMWLLADGGGGMTGDLICP